MAQYKVLQDIEAEDKLVGPLSLRQFIYVSIAAVGIFIAYLLFRVAPFLAFIPLPIVLFFGALGSPFLGGYQPSEIWLLAKVRFLVKPRKRIWSQTGVRQIVTITAPKQEEKQLYKDFSRSEVKSRLSLLANTLDSRGWATKNISAEMAPVYNNQNTASTQRLFTPVAQPNIENPTHQEDIFDTNNTKAARLDKLMKDSSEKHLANLRKSMTNPQPQTPQKQDSQLFTPPGEELRAQQQIQQAMQEDAISAYLKERHPTYTANNNLKTINPITTEQPDATIQPTPQQQPPTVQQTPPNPLPAPVQPQTKATPPPAQQKMTPKNNPAILQLATNDDLSVATIERQVNKKPKEDNEVIISLH